MRESKIERYLVGAVKAIGGMSIKQQGTRGIPDRLVLHKGYGCFVELKQIHGSLKPHQKRCIDRIEAQGIDVWILWTKQDVDAFTKRLTDA